MNLEVNQVKQPSLGREQNLRSEIAYPFEIVIKSHPIGYVAPQISEFDGKKGNT